MRDFGAHIQRGDAAISRNLAARVKAAGLICLLCGMTLSVPAEEPALVELVKPDNSSPWIGQKTTFAVEVAVEGRFSGSTLFDLPQLSGAILMKPEERAVLSTRTVDGREYSVQRHEFAIFYQRSGAVELPAFSVRCGSVQGIGQPVQQYTLSVPGFRANPRLPGGSRAGEVVITTTRLKVSETWEPQPQGEAKVGDAFRRIITLESDDVPGMLLPVVLSQSIAGMAVYSDLPQVTDRTARGAFTGQRREIVTYMCEQAGRTEIPAVEVRWWNPSTSTWQEHTLPAVTLQITAADPLLTATVGEPPQKSLRWILLLVGVVVLAGACFLLMQKREPNKEAELFKELLTACRGGRASDAYNVFTRWRVAAGMDGEELPEDMAASLEHTQRVLTGIDESWQREALERAVVEWRKNRRPRSASGGAGGLPPLNPS